MSEAGVGERVAQASWLILARRPVPLLDLLYRRQPPEGQQPEQAAFVQAWTAMLALEQPGVRLNTWVQHRSWLQRPFAPPGHRLASTMALDRAALAELRRARAQYSLSYEGPALPGSEHLARLRAVVLWTAELCRGVVMDLAAHRVVPRPAVGWLRDLDDPHALQVTRQVTAEVVDEDGYWIHTHGMAKYGLPELELRRVPPEVADLAGFLLAALGSGAVEGRLALAPGELAAPGAQELVLELRDVLDPQGHYAADALRIVAPGAGGGSPEAIGQLLLRMVQATDPMVLVKDDDPALLAAHERATAELPAVRARFQAADRKPTDQYLVKVGWPPEPKPEEYLWVMIEQWRDHHLHGTVAVHPQAVEGLRYGARLDFDDSRVFDWLILHDDGSREGNYTGEVLRAAQAQRPPEQG